MIHVTSNSCSINAYRSLSQPRSRKRPFLTVWGAVEQDINSPSISYRLTGFWQKHKLRLRFVLAPWLGYEDMVSTFSINSLCCRGLSPYNPTLKQLITVFEIRRSQHIIRKPVQRLPLDIF